MFTIKWVVKSDRGEVIRMIQCDDFKVAYAKVYAPGQPCSSKPWIVDGRVVERGLAMLDTGVHFNGRTLDCGTVYVMNDQGATVGKYILSDDPIIWENQPDDAPPQQGPSVAMAA